MLSVDTLKLGIIAYCKYLTSSLSWSNVMLKDHRG
jgi:hypothetical protein